MKNTQPETKSLVAPPTNQAIISTASFLDSRRERAELRQRAMKKTSVVSAIVNTLLTVLKVVIGIVGQSTAMVADGIHSLADLSTDLMVWIAAKYSNQPADEDHPYGHARIETMFTVGLGTILILTAIGIIWNAFGKLLSPESVAQPTSIVLYIAVVSILANEGLYQYTMIYAKKFQSNLLKANAWHHRTDAISSVIVLLGVGASMIGWTSLDAIAAIGVGLMIAKIGWDQFWHASLELVDTALSPEETQEIYDFIHKIEGVIDAHDLRTRSMGGRTIVDVHIVVEPYLSVSEGHHIATYLYNTLTQSDKDIDDVLVHIDPEDDRYEMASASLPLRQDILRDLTRVWQQELATVQYERITLHYLDGKVEADVFFQHLPEEPEYRAALQANFLKKAQLLGYIRAVRLYASVPDSLIK